MEESSFIDDLREIKENWHDAEYRNAFLIELLKGLVRFVFGFIVAFLAMAVFTLIT